MRTLTAGDPTPDTAEAQSVRGWDANAGRWSDAVRQGRIASRAAGTDRAIVEAVLAQAPRRIADIGCGEGWLVRRLRTEGNIEIAGFDGSSRLIGLARAADPEGDYRVCSYRQIVERPACLGGRYDVVICNFSLFERDLAPLLRGLAAALTPATGRLLIQTLHPVTVQDENDREGWREERFGGLGDQPWVPMRWYFRTIASWIDLIHASGLSISACREPLSTADGRPLSLIWMLRAN